jgi:DNA-binding transcriptional MerR regulator
MSKLTQIPLDFGPEDQPQPDTGQAGNASGNEPARQYIAAEGVGVRIRYKRPATPPAESALFGEPAPATSGEPAPAPETSSADEHPPSDRHAPPDALTAADEPSPAEPTPAFDPAPAYEPPPTTSFAASPADAPPTAKPAKPAPAPSKRGRKSLKQVGAEADLIEIPEDEVLFSKQYYTMGEVAEMFRVNQSLLRFWETEFDILQPKKNKKGDRYFRPVDIKSLHLSYHLLRQKKYTIEGAKEFLKKNKKAEERFQVIQRLQQIRTFLLEWKAQL